VGETQMFSQVDSKCWEIVILFTFDTMLQSKFLGHGRCVIIYIKKYN